MTINFNFEYYAPSVHVILDCAKDLWSCNQCVMYDTATEEEYNKESFSILKDCMAFIKLAIDIDKRDKLSEKNAETAETGKSERMYYLDSIHNYLDLCYLSFAIDEYNRLAEILGEEKFENPWPVDEVDDNYNMHFTEVKPGVKVTRTMEKDDALDRF